MHVLIIGCGYSGTILAEKLLAEGISVTGTRRSWKHAENELQLLSKVELDLSNPEQLRALPQDVDYVVNMTSSNRGGASEYQKIFLEGNRSLAEVFRQIKGYYMTSSTSVYSQTSGEWVDESSPANPTTQTGQILRQAEELVLQAFSFCQPVVFRVAGIYGQGRAHLLEAYLDSRVKWNRAMDRYLNMIHVEDLARLMVAALKSEQLQGIFNAVDDLPVKQSEFYLWLSQETKGKLPEECAIEEIENRKRGVSNKRVSNTKIKQALGFSFTYPTFRQGYGLEVHSWRAAQTC